MAPLTTSSTDDGIALVLPDRLYGRDAPYARLAEAWQEAADGERVLALVSGYSGVGKTALVQRLRAEVVAGGGLFVAGKHDQLRRGTPYLAIAEALTQLAHRLRDLPATEFTLRANALRAAMGGLDRVMLELAPALGPVLGDPPPVPVLSGVEARPRTATTKSGRRIRSPGRCRRRRRSASR